MEDDGIDELHATHGLPEIPVRTPEQFRSINEWLVDRKNFRLLVDLIIFKNNA